MESVHNNPAAPNVTPASTSFSLRRTLRARPELLLIPTVFVAVVAVWEAIIRFFEIPIYIMPAPSNIALALVNTGYLDNALYTLGEAMLGFLLAALFGIVLGGLIAQFPLAEKTLYPYLIAIQTTPKVAVAPLFIMWFGFGMTSKVIIAATIAFFPILVNVISGLRSTDPARLELMRSLRATRWQIFTMVRLPGALPMIFAGLNIAIIFSILGAIVGEFLGSRKGLGNAIMQMNVNLDTAGVFATLFVLSAIGVCLHVLMSFLQRKALFWADSSRIPTV
ncbi:ABC transporter permease [Herbaspirillum hiltneri N3]|uniref:ABC transporter permease n=1 Tax=Herbaspirillum hiltneri N3 TaxID=1262470 RepID=A0ABN4HTT4_9BURK|nr:ABC transporter permease [Herbaspirillum hiltneri]AKZ61532.1 ABC transporter permease [Herbaspirillum hiltneri N3]